MNTIEISTAFGTVTGRLEEGIAAFRGICYADTPRWQKATESFHRGMISAVGPSVDPVQPTGDAALQSEDELFLNIYLNPAYEGPRAVLAYTPVGGGVHSRGRSIRPHRFLQEHPEILVVVCNCRVGLLSSLNLSEFDDRDEYGSEYDASCNLTKTDFALALNWIKKYISAFGGDPGNVTISGHSYGATVTCSMLLMPEAEGLFHKALPRSCAAIDSSMLMSLEESRQYARVFRRITGITTIREALKIPAREFLEIQASMMRLMPAGIPDGDFPGTLCPPFCTVADGTVIAPDYFAQLCRTAEHVKLLTGTTSGDCDARFDFRGSPDDILNDLTVRYYDKLDASRGGTFRDTLLETYTESHNGDFIAALADLNGDLGMRKGALATAEVFARLSTAYMYYYDFYLKDDTGRRALHGSAENAAWGNAALTPDVMARTLRDSYASFMTYGDPNVNNPSFIASRRADYRSVYKEELDWKPYTPEEPYTMVFDNSGFGLREGVRLRDAEAIIRTVREYPQIAALKKD